MAASITHCCGLILNGDVCHLVDSVARTAGVGVHICPAGPGVARAATGLEKGGGF
jgi:hypothetical protein